MRFTPDTCNKHSPAKPPPKHRPICQRGMKNRKIHTRHHLDPFWHLVCKSSIFSCHKPAHGTLTWALGLPHEMSGASTVILHQLNCSCKSAPAKADGPPPTSPYKPHLSLEKFRKFDPLVLRGFFLLLLRKGYQSFQSVKMMSFSLLLLPVMNYLRS